MSTTDDDIRQDARRRVGATWARLLAEKHPGRRFVIEWREPADVISATPRRREITGHVEDAQDGRTAA